MPKLSSWRQGSGQQCQPNTYVWPLQTKGPGKSALTPVISKVPETWLCSTGGREVVQPCVSMHPGRKDHMGSAHLCMPEFSLTYCTARRRCTSRCCLETSCPFVADNTSVGDQFLSLNFLASYWKVASICLAWPVRLGIYFAHGNTRVAVTGFLLSHLIEVGTIVITQLHWP